MPESDANELATSFGIPPSARWTQIVARRGRSVWRVDFPDRKYTVRIFRPGDDKSALHEHRMMLEARKISPLVPAVHAAHTLEPRPALLTEWLPGEDIGKLLYARPWRAMQLGHLIGEQQAVLHRDGKRDLQHSDWIDFFGPVDADLRKKLLAAERSCTLIHLDFHPGNLLAGRRGICGILDWTNARFGDPRADLARTWTLLRLIFRSGLRHPVRHIAERLFEWGWWRGYVGIAGRPQDMKPFLVWAVFGVMLVKSREPDTPGRQSEMAGLARLADRLGKQAGLRSVVIDLPTGPAQPSLDATAKITSSAENAS